MDTELKSVDQLVKEKIHYHLRKQLPSVLLRLICDYIHDEGISILVFGVDHSPNVNLHNLRLELRSKSVFSLTEWMTTIENKATITNAKTKKISYCTITTNRKYIEWKGLDQYLNTFYEIKFFGDSLYCTIIGNGWENKILKWKFATTSNNSILQLNPVYENLLLDIYMECKMVSVIDDRWIWLIVSKDRRTFSLNKYDMLTGKFDNHSISFDVNGGYNTFNLVAVSDNFILVAISDVNGVIMFRMIDLQASFLEWKEIESPFPDKIEIINDIFVRNGYFYLFEHLNNKIYKVRRYSPVYNHWFTVCYEDKIYSKRVYDKNYDRLFLISRNDNSPMNIYTTSFDKEDNIEPNIIKISTLNINESSVTSLPQLKFIKSVVLLPTTLHNSPSSDNDT